MYSVQVWSGTSFTNRITPGPLGISLVLHTSYCVIFYTLQDCHVHPNTFSQFPSQVPSMATGSSHPPHDGYSRHQFRENEWSDSKRVTDISLLALRSAIQVRLQQSRSHHHLQTPHYLEEFALEYRQVLSGKAFPFMADTRTIKPVMVEVERQQSRTSTVVGLYFGAFSSSFSCFLHPGFSQAGHKSSVY